MYAVIGTRQNFPYTKVWWLREAAQIGQMFIALCEKVVFENRIPIDPAILAAIGHRFIAKEKKKKRKLKMQTHGSAVTHAETRKQRLFFWGGGWANIKF